MALSVTHAFNCALADDPKAASKGEILISHWNADHVISGIKETLLADRNYYVSATGSDSNGGTDPTTDAWATVQHGMFFIAANIDFGGHTIFLKVGTGSFAGFGVKSFSGGGQICVVGNGAANTTLTPGPNDGIYNQGDVIDLNFICDTVVSVDDVTLNNSDGTGQLLVGHFAPATFFQLGNGGTGTMIYKPAAFPTTNGQIFAGSAIGALFGVLGNSHTIISQTTGVYTSAFSIDAYMQAFDIGGVSWTFSGSFAFNAWIYLTNGSFWQGNSSTFTGSATGTVAVVTAESIIQINGHPSGLTRAIVDNTSAYMFGQTIGVNPQQVGQGGALAISGKPTTTNLVDGTFGMFKDTTGGGVYLAYNDAGTIKSVALTT